MPRERIEFLINNLEEGLDVEVKNWLGGIQSNDAKAVLAKEIIALANHGGGYIFIGFEDEGEGHPEIEPGAGELEAFTQDAIAQVIQRYASPPFQCSIGHYSREGSEIRHPVITIPGEHRTPIWARRGSPDQTTLQSGKVYVRRPGGASEAAQNQDDWEKLLERLVKARQADQLNAIREIINPSDQIIADAPSLVDWHEESLAIWQGLVDPLPDADARTLSDGYWSFAFEISPFDSPSLGELNETIERGIPKYSGWPPFTYLHHDPSRPAARGNIIQAWLARSHETEVLVEEDEHCDFWRISRDGKGFLLRPMQEDRSTYLQNRHPRPTGKFFDWTLPIYRATELLKYVEAMALRYSDENARYRVLLKYHGADNRVLKQHDFKYQLRDGAQCHEPVIETQLEGVISEIGLSTAERVFALLSPIYEQFEFTVLPKVLVDNVVREALNYR